MSHFLKNATLGGSLPEIKLLYGQREKLCKDMSNETQCMTFYGNTFHPKVQTLRYQFSFMAEARIFQILLLVNID